MAFPVFLTAEWRALVMVSWAVDPQLLLPRVPAGTELDTRDGRDVVSLVGFLFRDTRVAGWAVPGHRDFEEVNLRFYVRRRAEGAWRRGVVFVRELVPRHAVTAVARWIYGEPYLTVPMSHRVSLPDGAAARGAVEYRWRHAGRACLLGAEVAGAARLPDPDSEAAFITEHYWGYSRGRGGTREYEVQHARWSVWPAATWSVEGDLRTLYGPAFAEAMAGEPDSAFVADGSPVVVRRATAVS